MIEAVIFDMDGLLIDSEPLWRKAEVAAFAQAGVSITEEMCLQTLGLRIDEVMQYWFQRFDFQGQSPEEIEARMLHEFRELLGHAQPMAGVHEALAFFNQNLALPVGLASSSPMSIIQQVVDQLGIRSFFQALCSGEDDAFGKPHPAVFLRAANLLGAKPDRCLVFEDSVTGAIAAKAARMRLVAVPDPAHFHDPRFALAELKLNSLREFSQAHWEKLNQHPS